MMFLLDFSKRIKQTSQDGQVPWFGNFFHKISMPLVDNPLNQENTLLLGGNFCYGSVVSFNMIYVSQLMIGWLLFG